MKSSSYHLEESGETHQTSGDGDGWLVKGGSAGEGNWTRGGGAGSRLGAGGWAA